MSGSAVKYMEWRGSLKQGSLENTPSFRHCIYDIFLQSNVLCYIQNSNMECGTCKLYTFFNWTDKYRSVEHH